MSNWNTDEKSLTSKSGTDEKCPMSTCSKDTHKFKGTLNKFEYMKENEEPHEYLK